MLTGSFCKNKHKFVIYVEKISKLWYCLNKERRIETKTNRSTNAAPILNYHVTTPFESSDSAICAKVRQIAGSWGYSAYVSNLPSARELFNDIPNNRITIIHGHGSAGKFALKQDNNSTQYLTLDKTTTSNNRSLWDYSEYELNSNVLILDNCCQGDRVYSIPGELSLSRDYYLYAYGGAQCVIGYKNDVYLSGEWGQYFFEYSDNNLNIRDAAERATTFFKSQFPDNNSNYPTASNNQTIYGNTQNKIMSLN